MPTAAFVGATGGAGTTRTVLECAALLARDDRTVAVIDTAYATQGLGEYLDRVETDVTALALDGDRTIGDATHELSADVAGRLALVPARAPFERLARAKTVTASQRLASRITDAADRFDHVLLDVPPVAANPHVAACQTADRLVGITPGTPHGADAHRRLVDRLADVDCTLAATLTVGGSLPAADATVPTFDSGVADAPTVVGDDESAQQLTAAVESAVGTELAIQFETPGPLGRVTDAVTDSA